MFQVQADIAGRVAQALDVALGAAERQRLAERPTANLAAYDAYLKGEEISARLVPAIPSRLRRAAGYYEQAVALDSTFALGLGAALAGALVYLRASAARRGEPVRLAHEAAERALALAPERRRGPPGAGRLLREPAR